MARRTHRLMKQLTSTACLGFGLLVVTSAFGVVTQPDGKLSVPIPQSKSNDYFEDPPRRYSEATLGIQSLLDTWEGVDEAGTSLVDAYKDASATNVVFSPLCGLKGAMILRGGACQVDFGWYCVDDPKGQEVIHPLVTAEDIVTYHDVTLKQLSTKSKPPAPLNSWVDLQNNDKGFVPTVQSGFLQPVEGAASLAKVRESPEFQACKSGKIGFAFKGNPKSICPMSKFSEPDRNQLSSFDSKPWINAVVYESKKTPGAFYIAFEDMPTSTSSFTPTLGSVAADFPQMTSTSTGWKDWKNDGDFNDFVFRVDGIVCEGGGKACVPSDPNTGEPLKGACSMGVTGCAPGPGLPGVCQARVQPSAEKCDGWDNDCDGIADDDPGLCPVGQVCSNGQCVGACGSEEFPCTGGLVCQNSGPLKGYCVEEACQNVECTQGQRCSGGKCVGGCEGVVCQDGLECIAGSCVDLCKGITCQDSTFVCERGACVPSCSCLPCTDPAKSFCNVDGHCIDQACAGIVCSKFQVCKAGSCVDPCVGDPCGGTACTPQENGTYSCAPASDPNSSTPGSGPNVAPGGTGTSPTVNVGGPTVTPGSGNGTTGTNGNMQTFGEDDNGGCGCRVVGANHQQQRGALLLAMIGLAAAVARIGRSSRSRS